MKFEDYILAQTVYEKNENITEALKKKLKVDYNTPEIIAAAYDLQAGSYSIDADNKPKFYQTRAKEVSDFISSNVSDIESILDVGSGELTMFSRVASNLSLSAKSEIKLYASDISLSRLVVGRNHLNKSIDLVNRINLAVADTAKLPFRTKSVDIVTSDHALEPNGARISEVLNECFRVARRYCVFVEPNNSLQESEGKERMKTLGYIFDIEKSILELGGKIKSQHITINNYNQLNKSKMLVVEVPNLSNSKILPDCEDEIQFTYPGTDHVLQHNKSFLYDIQSGFLFPKIDNVSLLLEQNRILFSKYNL
jgi:ubiquinone/menaquinone biosynthesis C-methylase UbiE